MYEAYTPPPSTGGGYNIFGIPSQRNVPNYPYGMFGSTGPSKPSYESITVDGQEFRTVKPELAGFNRMALSEDDYQKDSVYEYSPSMAYVYSQAPKPEVLPTPNVTSFLSTPIAMATPTGNYGAGRYLGGNGLLGLDFGLPSGQSAND